MICGRASLSDSSAPPKLIVISFGELKSEIFSFIWEVISVTLTCRFTSAKTDIVGIPFLRMICPSFQSPFIVAIWRIGTENIPPHAG
ncbi:unknown [Tannerella sp. CAG:118]|nr:unknown [Tannerella sp. CAG:118]